MSYDTPPTNNENPQPSAKRPAYLIIFAIIVFGLALFGYIQDGKHVTTRTEIRETIKDLIKEDPEFILTALQEGQQRKAEKQEQESKAETLARWGELKNDTTSPFAGNANGSKVMVEFFDYSCGYCKRVLPAVKKVVDEHQDVKVIFMELPILGPASMVASRAALAVHRSQPEKYFDYHAALMANRVNNDEEAILLASSIGINTETMKSELASPELEKIINANRDLARGLGIRGTPAFVIEGELFPGAIDYGLMKEKLAN